MADIFLSTLDTSLSASWIILAVLAARLLMKKAPRWMVCGLWALVALRLLCPFSLESSLSLIPEHTVVEDAAAELLDGYVGPTQFYHDNTPEYRTAVEAGRQPIPAGDGGYYVVTGEDSVSEPKTAGTSLFPILWLAGIAALALYAAVSYLRIRKKVQVSIDLGNGVHICDYIDTPFILGLVKPKIYLPSAIHPADTAHVLAHERAHLKRRDHWWKPLGYCLLMIHWFNPLLWIAYCLLCRDIELACDERVVRDMPVPEKKAYSEALLKCSVKRHMIAACPLAFGEVGVKQRIKSILNYKKPGFWVLLVGLLVILTVAVCFLTDKPASEPVSPFEEDLWVTELVYSAEGEPLHNAPANMMDILEFSLNEASFTTDRSYFLETQLSTSNFDALFDSLGQWQTLSAKKLRQQNKNAWILHDNATASVNDIFHRFYYLLQQKNGDLYLTQGICWDAQMRPGKTTIEWVFKLDKAAVSNPFQDGDTPFPYTRTIDTGYFESSGWIPLSYPQLSPSTEMPLESNIFITDILNILHSIPEEAFTLGKPIENVEISLILDIAQSEIFDVELHYGENIVEMVFHDEAPWNFAQTGNQVWHIDHQGLKDFFACYSPSFTPVEYLQQPLAIHNWRKQITLADIKSVPVCIITPMRHNYGYHMGTGQIKRLLEQLKDLPDSAFVPTDFDLNVFEADEAGCIQIVWNQGVFADAANAIYAEIVWIDDTLYFFFRPREGETALQAWEIRNEDFLTWQSTCYDPTIRHGFHIIENPTGTISVSHGNASIQLNTYGYMDYEIIEYTDDETPFGIRMRPKITEEGYISVLYYPGGFTPDPAWNYSSSGTSNDSEVIFYRTDKQDQSLYPTSAVHYTGLAGDYVYLNEGLQVWAEEFYYDSSVITRDMLLGKGLLTRKEILEIARSLLPFAGENLTYLKLDNGLWRAVEVTFDSKTELWTVAAADKQTQEVTPLITLDLYGNVVQQFWFPG